MSTESQPPHITPETPETLSLSDRFKILNEEITLEQGFYWTRFSGFVTLHAGLFVLSTSDTIKHPLIFSSVAIFLGIIWFYVQKASHWYVNRLKPEFRKIYPKIGFRYPQHCIFSCPYMDITFVALLVPIIITFVWIAFFLFSLPSILWAGTTCNCW